jgi:hypothetical protein
MTPTASAAGAAYDRQYERWFALAQMRAVLPNTLKNDPLTPKGQMEILCDADVDYHWSDAAIQHRLISARWEKLCD